MEEEGRRDRDVETSNASRTAGSGFPLVRSLLGSLSPDSREEGENTDATATASAGTASSSASTAVLSESPAEAALRRLNATRLRYQLGRTAGVQPSGRLRGLMSDAALDTASMMMRGISEEEQIAMAIAASLQEQSTTQPNRDEQSNSSESSSSSEESSSIEENVTSDTPFESNGLSGSTSSSAGQESQEQGNGHEATTITELARVVTDSGGGVERTATNTPSRSDRPTADDAPNVETVSSEDH
ncbi:hypothetical protein IV203_032052 [Nitzschia inconspicua]|uniref:Uncharacterized protein n=1 Tax=Nitzschia inconspicua TaxID=303405 RepID=A0A9K3LWE2_9STRA|nr:hypothetical protein IV203_032052 [Nitzschia inconspicua]